MEPQRGKVDKTPYVDPVQRRPLTVQRRRPIQPLLQVLPPCGMTTVGTTAGAVDGRRYPVGPERDLDLDPSAPLAVGRDIDVERQALAIYRGRRG